jgi:hypothetical protein
MILRFGEFAPDEPRLCAACMMFPGWFRDVVLRVRIDPDHDGNWREDRKHEGASDP